MLSQEERNDAMKFYYNSDRDIVYNGLRVDMVIAFMAANKTKPNGKCYSHTHMRKVHDALLFGSKRLKLSLSTEYHTEMESFLQSFNKEATDAQK